MESDIMKLVGTYAPKLAIIKDKRVDAFKQQEEANRRWQNDGHIFQMCHVYNELSKKRALRAKHGNLIELLNKI